MSTQTQTQHTSNGQLNRVGLKKDNAEEVVKALNTLLSDYQIYYQNLRGLHWNITGPSFFTLHEKFEELYTDAAESIDLVAERVLTLGSTPLHSYQAYLDHGHLEAVTNVSKDRQAVETVLHNVQHIIQHLRTLIELTDQMDDEGTNDMGVELMRNLEKKSWMLEAYLS